MSEPTTEAVGEGDPLGAGRRFEPDLRGMPRINLRPIASPMPLGFHTVAIASVIGLVTGRTVGNLALRPAEQLVSREQALELYKAGGARLTGEEADKRVLAEGRFADFAVLSHD